MKRSKVGALRYGSPSISLLNSNKKEIFSYSCNVYDCPYSENIKFICHLANNKRDNLFSFKDTIVNSLNSCILIGPEGDFTSQEISLSYKYNFIPITLGNSRLRTETAGIVSCNLINAIYES